MRVSFRSLLLIGAMASSMMEVVAFQAAAPVAGGISSTTTTTTSTQLSLLTPDQVDTTMIPVAEQAANFLSTTTQHLSLTEDMIPEAAKFARGYTVFWFFGASGAAGIGRRAFPIKYEKYMDYQGCKGSGPTKGGQTLGLPYSLLGLPEDVAIADIQQVIENPLSVEQIVAKYPIPEEFASKNNLIFEAFELANPKANPLAVRVVFDSLYLGGRVVPPKDAQKWLDKYKTAAKEGDVTEVKSRIILSQIVDYFAVTFLLFLLGLADILTFSDAYKGWFPDWPGGNNFPISLFTEPDGGIFSIPNYWI